MKSEKGITLIALAVTTMLMMIIGLTIFNTAYDIDENTKDDLLKAELEQVYHVVLQENSKKQTLGDDYTYKGTVATTATINYYNPYIENKFSTDKANYYILNETALEQIGIKKASASYLVCYDTGEVANITQGKNSTGEVLYKK